MRRYLLTESMEVTPPPPPGRDPHKVTFRSVKKNSKSSLYLTCAESNRVDWEISDAAFTVDTITGELVIVPQYGSYPTAEVKAGVDVGIGFVTGRFFPYMYQVKDVLSGERNPSGAVVVLSHKGSRNMLLRMIASMKKRMTEIR